MKTLLVLSFMGLIGCGSSTVAPPPAATGTISFTLQNCQTYATAEYVVDSTTVGREAIVPGAVSAGYTVPSGKRSAIARLTKQGSSAGLWTFRNTVQVPDNGSVTATLAC